MRNDYMLIAATRAAERRAAHRQQQVRAARALMSRPGICVPYAANVRAIRRAAGEKKLLDTSIDVGNMLTTTDTNDDILVLNLIRAGNGYWNRVGRKVFLKSIRLYGEFFGQFTQPADGDNLGATIRMVVVWDKQPSGNAIPTFNTIFGHTDQAGTEATDVLDPIRPDSFGRFQILRDCKININPPDTPLAAGDVTNVYQHFDEYIKLGNKVAQYGGDSSPMTIADINSGALYVVFRTTQTTATESVFTTSARSFARLRYSD